MVVRGVPAEGVVPRELALMAHQGGGVVAFALPSGVAAGGCLPFRRRLSPPAAWCNRPNAQRVGCPGTSAATAADCQARSAAVHAQRMATRRRIIAGAAELRSSIGLHQTSLEDVFVTRLMSVAAALHYFSGKREPMRDVAKLFARIRFSKLSASACSTASTAWRRSSRRADAYLEAN